MITDIQITIVQGILENYNPDVPEDESLQDLSDLLRQYQREILGPQQEDHYVQQLAALSSSNPTAFAKVQAVLSPAMRDRVQTAISVINPPIKIK